MLKKFFIVTAFVSIFNLSTGLEISHAATTNANQSHWAYPSVQALVSKGYIQEKQNYSTKLTRGEVSIALARFIKEEPAATFKLKASDINSKASYYYAVISD